MAPPASEGRTAVAVLNGDPPPAALLTSLAAKFPVYAADGGANACLAAGVRPVWVTGDGDSMNAAALPADWTLIPDDDQAHSDFEKLLARLPAEVEELVVLGGLSTRMDHVWNNLLICAALPARMRVVWRTADARLWRVTPQCGFHRALPPDSLISLLPAGTAEGVCASGLRWSLENATLGPGAQLSQSNRVGGGGVDITLARGVLFVWAPEPG